MTICETRYEIMECEDEGGFKPAGESEWTMEEAEARLQELREGLPDVHRNAFICKVVTTRLTVHTPEVDHVNRKARES